MQASCPYLPPVQLPYNFNINLGHIMASHGFNSQHFYVKSMFCRDLLHSNVLWQLITHAFVTVCGSQSSSPMDTCPRAGSHACDYAVIRYKYPYGIGWSVHGRVARWLYLRYRYNGHMQCLLARPGCHKFLVYLALQVMICIQLGQWCRYTSCFNCINFHL